jgi:hypothetical protein
MIATKYTFILKVVPENRLPNPTPTDHPNPVHHFFEKEKKKEHNGSTLLLPTTFRKQ